MTDWRQYPALAAAWDDSFGAYRIDREVLAVVGVVDVPTATQIHRAIEGLFEYADDPRAVARAVYWDPETERIEAAEVYVRDHRGRVLLDPTPDDPTAGDAWVYVWRRS